MTAKRGNGGERGVLILVAIFVLIALVVRQEQGQASSATEPHGSTSHTFWFPVVHKPYPQATQPGSGPAYGVVFMSSAEAPADARQYENALATGAALNRWPIYWPIVESTAGAFDWQAQDATVRVDLAHGLQINAILLGTPAYYQTGAPLPAPQSPDVRPQGNLSLYAAERATPQGLYAPVFSDGTDAPAPGKTINPANRWARFVFLAVNRYKPGGVLAQQHNWSAGQGVRIWEMWNEPDLTSFWDGSLADYARLLKVGYLAAKQADAQAQVLFGGLANFSGPTFYGDVLEIYDGDPLAGPHRYFHDILATHNYSYSWRSWQYVYNAGNTMRAHGLQKPIWLNESGVRAWNDYPGPVWDPHSSFSATRSEQADFVIQSAFYATFAGARAIFHFQLYDGCGNQPAGTDFPPHNGELCTADGRLVTDPDFPCAGDANGLFTNPTDAACFRQHPNPESPRPNYAAFRVLTTHLRDVVPLWRRRPGDDDNNPVTGPQEWIAFYRPATGQRIVGMWSRVGNDELARLPAIAAQATLVRPDGRSQTITTRNGVYEILLPGATYRNTPTLAIDNSDYAIGGRPMIVIENGSQPPQALQPDPWWEEDG